MVEKMIEKMLIRQNFKEMPSRKIEFIVIHDTGNPASGADALMHFRYFDSALRNASAHFFVDDKRIIQTVEEKNIAWHVGDAKEKVVIAGATPTNANSIGIEICINKDGDYFKALQNAILLTKYLMGKYNLPIERVIRHYDVSKKWCPQSMSGWNGTTATWVVWEWFLKQLKNV